MRITSIQQNPQNFKGGMLFSQAKQVTTRAIDATPEIKQLFLNSINIVSMRPAENVEPLAFKAGYKTLIDMVNNMTFAVKESFDICNAAWSQANSTDNGILDVKSIC